MTTNRNTPIKTYQNKQIFRSAVRLLFGGILGATAYIGIIVIDQSVLDYDLGFIRHVIDASLFPAALLVLLTVPDKSIFYLPTIYGLSSLPFAVLGALIADRVEKVMILLFIFLITFYLCLSWFFAGMCAALLPS